MFPNPNVQCKSKAKQILFSRNRSTERIDYRADFHPRAKMQTWMHTSYTSWEPETYVFKQTLPLKGFGEPPDRPELAIDVGTEMGQLKRASHSQIQLYNGTRFKVSLLQWQEMTISIRIFARAKEKAPRKLLSS